MNTIQDEKYYVKKNVSLHEYKMHLHVYNLHIVNIPEIIGYDKNRKILTMININKLNLSDMYGENPEDIDTYLFDEIRTIIKKLAANNIEYPDITGYNFIEKITPEGEVQVWIIDFEHSRLCKNITNKFVKSFIGGLDEWNPDFR